MANVTSAFSMCQDEYGADAQELILCISNQLETKFATQNVRSDRWLLVLSGALLFLMQLGFSMMSAGSVRRKNSSNLLLNNVLDTCVVAMGFFTFGYAFAFGSDDPSGAVTFVGTDHFFLSGDVDLSLWFYQYTNAVVATTITAGVLAERSRNSGYVSYSTFMSSWVFPVVAHSLWSTNGFLSPYIQNPVLGVGCIDFAGSGGIHMVGGVTAFVSAYILGPRRGRFYDSNGDRLHTPREIPGHSVSLQVMGVLMLWFGWFGFNSGQALLLPNGTNTGSIAGTAAANTVLAGAAGAVAALLTNMYQVMSKSGRTAFDLPKTMKGALSGLVAVSAGVGVFEAWAAVLCGVIAAWVYLLADNLLIKIRVDDPVHGIPVHAFSGLWGLLATGLLASPQRMIDAYGHDTHVGWFYSIGRGSFDANLLGAQITAAVFIIAWVVTMMFPFFFMLSAADMLRIDEMEEIAGLDAAYQSGKQEDDEKLKADIREEFKKFSKEKTKTLSKSSQSSDVEDPVASLSRRTAKSGDKSITSMRSALSNNTTTSEGEPV